MDDLTNLGHMTIFNCLDPWEKTHMEHKNVCSIKYIYDKPVTYQFLGCLSKISDFVLSLNALAVHHITWLDRSSDKNRSKTWCSCSEDFLHVFGRTPGDLQRCFVQLKTFAPSARYSTFNYLETLKPRLGVTKGHRKLYI